MEEKNCKSSAAALKKRAGSPVQPELQCANCSIQYEGIVSDDGEVPLINDGDKNPNACSKSYKVLATLTIEPLMFIYLFSSGLNTNVISNMMIDKGCLYYFNYSAEICSNLSNHHHEKNKVERLAADYSLYSNLLYFVAAFMMIFIAPWSDKYGRKLPLFMAMKGAFLTDIGYILCSIYFDSPLEFLVLSRLPAEMFGGFVCTMMIMFSLSSEQSSVENRTLKYTFLEVAFGLGYCFGELAGGFLYRYCGYLYVNATVAAFHLFACFWIIFVVEETKGLDKNMKWPEKAKDFFVCESFRDSLAVTCKPRTGKSRPYLLSLLISMCIFVLTAEGLGTIGFLYVHHVFSWDPSIYNTLKTISSLASFAVIIVLVPVFIRLFKINDFLLGAIGIISGMGKFIFIAFSGHNKYLYYAGLCVSSFDPLFPLAVRAAISKLVDPEELGRVFSILATCEAIMPILGTVVLTKIYESTTDIYPNITYIVTALSCVIPLVMFMWAYKSSKNVNNTMDVSADDHMTEKV